MEIVREIQPQRSRIAGVRAFANNPGSFGQSPRRKPVAFVIQTSESYDQLNQYVEAFLREAEKNPGLVNIERAQRLNKPQLAGEVDRRRAATTGLGAPIGRAARSGRGERDVRK